MQALVQTKKQQVPPLWVVTQGAMSVGPESEAVQVQQTPVWGLGRVVALEHPELQCRLLDLEPNTNEEKLAQQLHQELISLFTRKPDCLPSGRTSRSTTGATADNY